MNIYSYLNIYTVIRQRTPAHVNNNTVLCYSALFSILLNWYISNISNLYNLEKNLSLSFQTISDHMFSDPKSDNTLQIFSYVPGIYFILILCGNCPPWEVCHEFMSVCLIVLDKSPDVRPVETTFCKVCFEYHGTRSHQCVSRWTYLCRIKEGNLRCRPRRSSYLVR